MKLAELVSTFLSHELSGPIGAASNGLELMSEEGAADMAQQLVSSSITQAITRLRFYRQLFGMVKEGGEASLEELKKTSLAFLDSSKVYLDWSDRYTDSAGISISRRMGRLILCLIEISSKALIKGGEIAISFERKSESEYSIIVDSKGGMVKFTQEKLDAMSGKIGDDVQDSKLASCYFANFLAGTQNAAIIVEIREDSLKFRIDKK